MQFQMDTEEDQREATGFSKTIMNKKNAPPSSPGTSGFTDLQQVPENQSVSSLFSRSFSFSPFSPHPYFFDII